MGYEVGFSFRRNSVHNNYNNNSSKHTLGIVETQLKRNTQLNSLNSDAQMSTIGSRYTLEIYISDTNL